MAESSQPPTPHQPNAAIERDIVEAQQRVLRFLGWDTLETRGLDRLDFHDVGVATMRAVILTAFDAGFRSALKNQEI